jgi:hypothetical protein
MTPVRPLSGAFVRALALSLLATPLFAERAERPVERRFGPEIRSVEIENLAGRVEIRQAAAGRVAATVFAEPSAGKSGGEWTQAVEIEIEERGDRLLVRANYPLEDHRRYHYPGLFENETVEPEWLSSWLDFGSSTVEYQGRRVRVTGKPSSGTPTLWSDFVLELPAGIDVQVRNLVGDIRSTGVAGEQRLDGGAGTIEVSGGRGILEADTGSGDVIVAEHEGDVSADTGSGDVRLTGVRGESIDADTGSGDVRLERCTGAVNASTGSGDVIGRELLLGRRLRADTGSGDVKLSGDFAAVRDLIIDTGSGDVSLVLSGTPSVQLTVSTGSGDIDVDVAAMRVRRSRDEFVADLGAAEGDASIDTGSGDVTVREGR